MKKRVALARAIIHNPQLVFFDEPTTGLDPITTRAIHELISATYRRLKFTALIVTHEVPDIFPLVHRVALLHDGKIVVTGSPDEIAASNHPVMRSFLASTGERAELPQETET
jgi:phospholipid/cholesterol/gamma-HCH transport system ATP-binding protein